MSTLREEPYDMVDMETLAIGVKVVKSKGKELYGEVGRDFKCHESSRL